MLPVYHCRTSPRCTGRRIEVGLWIHTWESRCGVGVIGVWELIGYGGNRGCGLIGV